MFVYATEQSRLQRVLSADSAVAQTEVSLVPPVQFTVTNDDECAFGVVFQTLRIRIKDRLRALRTSLAFAVGDQALRQFRDFRILRNKGDRHDLDRYRR
jgi:hypothetical protein